MKKFVINFKKLFENNRHEQIKGVSEQITQLLTTTVLDNQKFSSTEMASILNTVRENVNGFLLSRREKLETDLKDCETALENLK